MTAGVTDLHVELWIELRAARHALAEKDTADNRTRLDTVLAQWDQAFDARHDCE